MKIVVKPVYPKNNRTSPAYFDQCLPCKKNIEESWNLEDLHKSWNLLIGHRHFDKIILFSSTFNKYNGLKTYVMVYL